MWDVRSSRSCLMYFDSERSKSTTTTKSRSTMSSSSSLSTATAHSGAIVSLAYTPDSNHIVSLGKDNQLRLWDAYNGRNTLVNYGRVSLSSALNPGAAETSIQIGFCREQLLFVPSGPNLLMLGTLDGELKRTLKGHFEPVTCCVYNSATNELYSGARDRNVLVWDTRKDETASDDSRHSSRFAATGLYSVLSTTGRPQDNWSDED